MLFVSAAMAGEPNHALPKTNASHKKLPPAALGRFPVIVILFLNICFPAQTGRI